MFKIGEYQLLDINRRDESGFYLKELEGDEEVILPFEEVIGEVSIGDSIVVFIYVDHDDNLVATMKTSQASLGDIAYLKLVSQVDFGAFFDIGLKRDLFVPLKEIVYPLKKNRQYLIEVYLDKSNRLCGTTKVYDGLKTDHSFKADDIVMGTVIRINPEVGVFVAVENKYKGMVPTETYFMDLEEGQVLDFRVVRVREDKKLDLSTEQKIVDQLEKDAEKIYAMLNQEGGRLNFHDKSDPEAIKKKFQMSKKAFKRAIGRLLKMDRIEIYESYIEKK
jgi:hypothetical protein